MPLFTYHALTMERKKRKGLIEAHNAGDAKIKLREQGLMVASIQEKKGTVSKENLKGEQLLSFTTQFSQLVGAGIPVYQSLMTLEEQYRGEPFDRIILTLCEKIKSGTPLSQAMAAFPQTYDTLYCSMIKAGESSGTLDTVLEKLAELLAKQEKLRNQMMTAMIYPSILAGVCLLVIALLLGFVVPSIEGIFAERQLNGFTQAVIHLSHWSRDWWWVYVPLSGAGIAWFVWKIRTAAGKVWLENFFLRLPFIRRLLVEAALARFCRTMGTLLKGGLPIIESLKISREVMHNATLEEELKRAEAGIIEGSSLSRELSKSRYIPQMVPRMLSVGEESGTNVIMMNKIATMYEQNLEKTLERMMALAQPVILIVMGIVIGAVILAIMLPLTDMSSFTI